jgi:hypothetical protein
VAANEEIDAKITPINITNLWKPLLLKVRNYGLTAQAGMMNHAHHVSVLLVFKGQFKYSLSALNLHFASFAFPVQAKQVVLVNFGHVDWNIQRSDNSRVTAQNSPHMR